MKKPKISFRIFGDSGPLTVSWFDGPKGVAIEAKGGNGVGFFSNDGTLLCIEFDDLNSAEDHQILEFPSHKVQVSVKDGKVLHLVVEPLFTRKSLRRPKRRSKSAA